MFFFLYNFYAFEYTAVGYQICKNQRKYHGCSQFGTSTSLSTGCKKQVELFGLGIAATVYLGKSQAIILFEISDSRKKRNEDEWLSKYKRSNFNILVARR